ncbi:OLC1v1000642C1 [Oldenlandia corymbosa var. corymbosa]|uniref:OLC1v1000642C1 n=1 Tax=Oldenlandia corymbosa var. corymbosa TaxID=529605 RepID=A0AAV1D3Q3_OLDCO|nr:OLC1v1000642C1 [Oldenlandia corymbosa var. corymbosa]
MLPTPPPSPNTLALGGHKSSHRKKTPIRNPAGNPRACRICPLVLPSGQALGGHPRDHYVSPAETQIARGGGGHVSSENDTCPTTYATVTASSMTSSDGDGASTRTPARRPMFDLNEPPEMESSLGPGADPEDQMRGDEHEVESSLPAKKNPPGSSSLAI